MPESKTQLDRRDFLRGSLAIAVGMPLVAQGEAGGFTLAASIQDEADAFLARFVAGWLPLETATEEADWAASTDVSEAHTTHRSPGTSNSIATSGAPEVIDTVRRLLDHKNELSDLTVRQLEKVRLRAAEAPGTIPEIVKARAEAEARQSAAQDGFAFHIRRGNSETSASANDIDRILVESRDLDERRAAWEASKEIGRPLREGILRLRELRNQVARAMGFDNFFALQVADYGMTVSEMLALCDRLIAETRPLHRQLHAWARDALAKRYKAEVPRDGKIPAHWLSNRWGQDWPGLVEGIDMDAPFKGKPKEFITEQAERFYASIGFPRLPKSFWEKSDLYPADPSRAARRTATPVPGTST